LDGFRGWLGDFIAGKMSSASMIIRKSVFQPLGAFPEPWKGEASGLNLMGDGSVADDSSLEIVTAGGYGKG